MTHLQILLVIALLPLLSCGRESVREGVKIEVALAFENYDVDAERGFGTRVDSVLLLEDVMVLETVPLIPMVFFGAGTDTLHFFYRDKLLRDGFDGSDSLLIGGDLSKNESLLGIIGWRMDKFPDASLLLGPTYSSEPVESPELAFRRADRVRRYVVEKWGVDSTRVEIADPVQLVCSESDSTCQDDLRGVKILSNSPEILRSLSETIWRRFFSAERFMVTVRVIGEYALSMDAEFLWNVHYYGELARFPLERRPVASREGSRVAEYGGEFSFSNLTDYFYWSSYPDPGIPDSVTAVARVTVDGVVRESKPIRIVERVFNSIERKRERGDLVWRFSLPLFKRNLATVDTLMKAYLRRHVVPRIDTSLWVAVTGHKSPGESLETARERAIAIRHELIAMGVDSAKITDVEVGDYPRYRLRDPQGRALQRSVVIVVSSKKREKSDAVLNGTHMRIDIDPLDVEMPAGNKDPEAPE